jgi:hypothetical protein
MSWFPDDRRSRHCPHTETTLDHSAGIERAVCPACGHVTFRFSADASQIAERTRFARPADRKAEEPAPRTSRGFWSR